MSTYTESVEQLIEKLIRLPGIGRRSAERIVNYILEVPVDDVKSLVHSIARVKQTVRFCSVCHNLSDQEVCRICQDIRRRKDLVCIVEKPSDITVIEKAGIFAGTYHVLMGAISPLEGRGPGDLKIDTLLSRIKQNSIKEIIIATDADTEGETTALYLTKILKPLGVKLTRIGMGIPMGSNLEYADSATVARAMDSRRLI